MTRGGEETSLRMLVRAPFEVLGDVCESAVSRVGDVVEMQQTAKWRAEALGRVE